MKLDVITLFPEMFQTLNYSISGKAQQAGHLSLHIHNLRDFAVDKYRTVDDYPFGGEPGMVLKPEPLKAAILSVSEKNSPHIIFTTPQGKPFSQKRARELAKKQNILIICGHYKGIDQRIRHKYVHEEISIGDFVLTGGELPAMVIIDSITRLLPDVLGDQESLETDSFFNSDRLGWPVYTRPEIFDGMKVPETLLSGHHKNISQWRIKMGLLNTRQKRPDLFKKLKLNQKELMLLSKENEIQP